MAIRRSSIVKAASITAIAAVIATVAIVADGFDVAQTPVNDSAVWALQAGDGDRYARINTELGEIDTVKDAQNPSELVQTASTALLLMERNSNIAAVDPSRPQDYTSESPDISDTPQGTEFVTATGAFVAYLTQSGRVYAARIDDGADAAAITIDPYADENSQPGAEQKSYVADSIAISTSGVLYAYSITEGAVLRFDLTTGQQLGFDTVPKAPKDEGTAITAVGSTWALLSGDGATLWISGLDPIETDVGGDAVLQLPSTGSRVYAATRNGLISFAIADGDGTTEVEQAGSLGIPARPTALGGTMYAAWLNETAESGLMWSSVDGERELDFNGQSLGAEPAPVLRTNDSRMILNDDKSGWVWTIPNGELVASSQDWSIVAANDDEITAEEEKAPVVTERKAPIAEDDQFGVRAGQMVSLPVLLNDHDPNEDVLTIDPTSVSAIAGSFGVVSVTNNSQDLAVLVAPGASGTTTFQYSVTDGTQSDGMMSEKPATVTLTVFGDNINTAPQWCGGGECTRDWPVLQVQPGRSASVEVLRGWVDPEGDPIYLASATNLGEVGSVASTPDGTVLFQHPDASLAGGTSEVTVRVSDIRGEPAEKALTVEVTATPSLTVEPFAVTATVDEPLTVIPSKYISGVAGTFAIQSAKTENEDGTTTTVDNGATSFTFVAPAAGNYFVSYTVQDDLTEVIGTVRIQVVAPDAQQLTASPITVFVRPKADATIDVFPSVTNPSKKVLLLSEALPSPIGLASLDVAVVNHELLRVKGSTADGQTGVLGTVRFTISDGTGNALQTAQGQATVILLPVSEAQAPIAVPDSITVRAGSQVDIPVLDNDLAPDGNKLILNPDGLVYGSKEGLAFVSGSTVRLLAPETPGDYEATYQVYTAGSPEIAGTAAIRITVLPVGDNRAPEPHSLVGRVLAGSSVSIPFDSFGVDPDGDSAALDSIVSQPQSGSATIAPTGDAIVYTSVPGFSGPVEFEYSVRDPFGESGTAFVRVGVIDQESNPSPVTYSDYVEVQLGATNTVSVQPAANDIDPAGKKLELIDVVPDAPEGSAEYDELQALIGVPKDGIVTLTAGETLVPRSFIYTVRNTTGDTASGLIVMKVVRESVPDHPRVVDTYLTVEDRSSFGSGIDVVTGKVTWNSGNISDLTLSLWGDNPDYSVSNWKISGALPEESVVIPFKLTGTNLLGKEVWTYGFLRIPGKNDIILALKSGTPPQEVNESESRKFDFANLVSVPSGETLVLDGDNITTAGTRADATCTLDGDSELTYTAGAGGPWVDYCAVPAKLAGQDDYTVLIVAIKVIPEEPLPILHSAAITHSPAADDVVFDMFTMLEWAGKEDNESITFDIDYDGDQFTVEQDVLGGSKLTIHAIDTAVAGRENTVRVSLSSNPDVASAALSLKVGPVPTELPKGGTAKADCSQEAGASSCSVKVIGTPGEVSIFREKLVVASVSVPATCTGVTAKVEDASTVLISWADDAPGAKCTLSFVVKDPRDQLSPDDRNGTILFDLEGFAKAPTSLTQSAYDDGVVTLSVNPGAATAAYPPLTGFEIRRGSTVVSECDTLGVCSPITGLTNGDKQTYEAFSINKLGPSKSGASTTAWAYRPPVVDDVTRVPIYKSSTSDSEGWVEVSIESTDSTAESFIVTGAASPVLRTGATTVEEVKLPVGTQSVVVTPVSEYDVPSGVGPTAGNTNGSVDVAGAPIVTSPITVSTLDDDRLQVDDFVFDDNFSDATDEILYLASAGGEPTCSANSSGGLTVSADAQSTSTIISGLDANTYYNVKACVSNGFGVAESDAVQGVPWNVPGAATGYSYTVSDGSTSGDFLIGTPAGGSPPLGFEVRFSNYPSAYGQDPGITARYCLIGFPDEYCGPADGVSAADPTRVFQIDLAAIAEPASCVDGGTLTAGATGSWGSLSPTVSVTGFVYKPDTGADITVAGNAVPADADKIKSFSVEVTWPSDTGGSLYSYTDTVVLNGANHIPCTP